MKLILGCMFLLVGSYVSAETIDCIYCVEGDSAALSTLISVVTTAGVEKPPNACNKDNVTASDTKSIDTTKQSCTKVDLSATASDKDYSVVIRSVADIDKCDVLDEAFDKLDSALEGVDFECNQCDEDKCNSASSIHMSLMILASSLMVYFMRS